MEWGRRPDYEKYMKGLSERQPEDPDTKKHNPNPQENDVDMEEDESQLSLNQVDNTDEGQFQQEDENHGDSEWQSDDFDTETSLRPSKSVRVSEEAKFYLWRDPLSRKVFKSENAYKNYISSKKYQKLLRSQKLIYAPSPIITEREDPDVIRERQRQNVLFSEDVNPHDWYLPSWNARICPFDDHVSDSFMENIEYMKNRYNLEIPYPHRVRNLPNLLQYLGVKVSIGHFPLSVSALNRKPSRFKSKQACQEYMRAKKDYSLNFDGNEAEYERFYDMKGLAEDRAKEPVTYTDKLGNVFITHADGTRHIIESKKSKKLKKIEQMQNTFDFDTLKGREKEANEVVKIWSEYSKEERSIIKSAQRKGHGERVFRIQVGKRNAKIWNLPRSAPKYQRD